MTRYPLSWPSGWRRAERRTFAAFGKVETNAGGYGGKRKLGIDDAFRRVAYELDQLGASNIVISTNLPTNVYGMPRADRGEPNDPGVAVYWESDGRAQCMAIDGYTRVADNIAAIARTLEDMRSIKRHGGAEILQRVFLGFAALPDGARPWREVLGFDSRATPQAESVEKAYRDLAKILHSDRGGSDEKMAELNRAREDARKELRQ